MKTNTKILITVLLFFIFLSPSHTTAQEALADTVSPNKVLVVHTTLEGANGLQKPVIKQMVIQKGLSRLLQREGLHKKDPSLYQIEVLGPLGKPIFRMNFQYPRVMTVPIKNPAFRQEATDDVPSQIQIDNPEVSLVVPFPSNASTVRIFQPGQKSPEVSMHIQAASELDITCPDKKSAPPPSQQGKFHILIMASGYSLSEMTAFNNRALSVEDQLLSTGPFSSMSSDIEIHTYANTSDLGCYNGCFSIDRLMCCDDFSVTSAATASGTYFDEIIIIHNTETYSGGGYRDYGSYKTNSYSSYCMVYDGGSSALMAVHEFGHSFGNLCDEYSYGDEGYVYYDCANCKPSCDEWTGLTTTCNLGCDARSDYFRPDDSIMKTYDVEGYNDVSIQNSLIPRLSYFIPDASESPVANIKANGTEGTVVITQGDSLVVTVSLDTGSLAGTNCDWWVAESAPDGWYYYSLSTLWTPVGNSYTDLSPTYQGALSDLGTYSVLNTSELSEGTYTFYFAIDTNKNGTLDFNQLYYDSVSVIITSE